MIVVSDTSSLNYLVRLGKIDVLRVLYQRVVIPRAVLDELNAVKAPEAVAAWIAELPEWVDVVSVLRMDRTLSNRLGAGEKEAISLAIEMAADVVLMDDQAGRLAAEARGLAVSGTLSVLLRASVRNLLDFNSSMAEIKALGFRVSPEVEATMKRLSRVAN